MIRIIIEYDMYTSIKIKNVYLFYIGTEQQMCGKYRRMLGICDQYNTRETMIGTNIVN